jgi:hypothetical protein
MSLLLLLLLLLLLVGTPRSYWLIIPAPPQTVEVLPGQVVTIYPAVQPQQLFLAGAVHPPVMATLTTGASWHRYSK